MIPNEEKKVWRDQAVKNYPLLRGITSKSHGYFCFNCLHSFRTENKLKSHKNVCKNKDFCEIAMLLEKDNALEFNQSMKSDKMPYIKLTLNV